MFGPSAAAFSDRTSTETKLESPIKTPTCSGPCLFFPPKKRFLNDIACYTTQVGATDGLCLIWTLLAIFFPLKVKNKVRVRILLTSQKQMSALCPLRYLSL